MSIVSVHGPQTFGSKGVTEVGPAMATASDPTNGLKWSFKLDQASTRTASLVWTFPTGTPATATGPGPHAVTFASAGSKAVTAVATGAGEGANPYPPAGTTNIPVTAVAGAAPRGVMPADDGGESTEEIPVTEEIVPEPSVGPAQEGIPTEPYDPSASTVGEVQSYVGSHPDELEDIYEAEIAGKNRTSLVTWLEEQFPFDPSAWTVSEVLDYAADNPAELEDIITAEKAGKNRTTLVAQLEGQR